MNSLEKKNEAEDQDDKKSAKDSSLGQVDDGGPIVNDELLILPEADSEYDSENQFGEDPRKGIGYTTIWFDNEGNNTLPPDDDEPNETMFPAA